MNKNKLYYDDTSYRIFCGNMEEILPTFEKESIDCIITDPPYELNFLNNKWDRSGISFQTKTWEHCFQVLKEGGYLLAFGGSRTYHKLASAIETAGFEIRDTILWVYGSGFPKSMNISKGIESKEKYGKAGSRQKRWIEQGSTGEAYSVKQTNNGCIGETKVAIRKHYTAQTELAKKWIGWGTCLKPAYEPIIMARKPFKGSLIENILKNNVGGLNIDGCRIKYQNEVPNVGGRRNHTRGENYGFKALKENCIPNQNGRFPANLITDGGEEVKNLFPNKKNSEMRYFKSCCFSKQDDYISPIYYCAKPSKKDRDEGLENNFDFERKNIHPTVKPTELMQYLIRLVAPKGAIILDPFLGSGSTGKACMLENRMRNSNYHFIGIEMSEAYVAIAKERILFAKNGFSSLIEDDTKEMTLFNYMEDQ